LTALNGAPFPVTATGWGVVLGTVLVATIIAVTAFLAGLQRIGPTDASMLSTLEPVVTVLLAALLFAERLAPITLLGGGLILAAVLLLTRAEIQASTKDSRQLEMD
jgi:drug/metabolite transporter (DMT)-like permease